MKNFTLILTFLLCGLMGSQAQKAVHFFGSTGNETILSSRSFNVSDIEEGPKFTITGKVLSAKNVESGTQVDIYSVLGAKVFSFTYTGNPVLLNLNKGIYIIRADKYTQKIIL